MAKGLDKILERIRTQPSPTLVNRYLALIAELPPEEKTTAALGLAEVLTRADPGEALRIAFMTHQANPDDVRALDVMITIMDAKGRYGKAEVLRNERQRLARAKPPQGGDDKARKFAASLAGARGRAIFDELDFTGDEQVTERPAEVPSPRRTHVSQAHVRRLSDQRAEAARPTVLTTNHPRNPDAPEAKPSRHPDEPAFGVAHHLAYPYAQAPRPADEQIYVTPFDLGVAPGAVAPTEPPRGAPEEDPTRLATTEGFEDGTERYQDPSERIRYDHNDPHATEPDAEIQERLPIDSTAMQQLFPPGDLAAAVTPVLDLEDEEDGLAATPEKARPANVGAPQKARVANRAPRSKPRAAREDLPPPLPLAAFWRTVHEELSRFRHRPEAVLPRRTDPVAQPNAPIASAEADARDAIKPLAACLSALLSGESRNAALGSLFDLLQSLWAGSPDQTLAGLLETLKITTIEPRFFGLYLDALLGTKNARRALVAMRAALTVEPRLAWAEVIFRRVAPCHTALSAKTFAWSPDEGVPRLLELLKKRPEPRYEALVLAPGTRAS